MTKVSVMRQRGMDFTKLSEHDSMEEAQAAAIDAIRHKQPGDVISLWSVTCASTGNPTLEIGPLRQDPAAS